jgi:TusA-related sulfurtransferase
LASVEITRTLDVQGVSCPVNAVRVKSAAASLHADELLEVLVDEGEALLRVAQTLKDAGYRIVKVEKRGEGFRIVVGRS